MSENIMLGCWKYPEMNRCPLPEEAETALEAAKGGHLGLNVKPAFYLGKQMVAGAKFGILCQVSPIVQFPDTELKVIVVYKDAGGKCVIDRIYNAIQDRPDSGNGVLGGWEYPQNLQPGKLPQRAATAFSAAAANHVGVDLTPLCYLGEQLVSGMNYGVLCLAKTVTETPVESLKVVVVHEDLDGAFQISRIYDILQDKQE